MPARLLDGRAARDALIPALIGRVKKLPHAPTLAIIQVGMRPDSTAYIGAKKKFADRIGVGVKHIQVPEDAAQEALAKIISECNAAEAVNGIIVQLPLPPHLDRDAAIEAIDPGKDVDALTSSSVSRWQNRKSGALLPATARGVQELLAHYHIGISGKHICVVGRSALVGAPVAAMCRNEGASSVTVCHSRTPDLAAETREADIIIVAVGKPGLIGAGHVKPGQVVVDVGINTVAGEKLEEEIPKAKLVGDVDFTAVSAVLGPTGAITPVPGGVGPMTVLALFENLADLCATS